MEGEGQSVYALQGRTMGKDGELGAVEGKSIDVEDKRAVI